MEAKQSVEGKRRKNKSSWEQSDKTKLEEKMLSEFNGTSCKSKLNRNISEIRIKITWKKNTILFVGQTLECSKRKDCFISHILLSLEMNDDANKYEENSENSNKNV